MTERPSASVVVHSSARWFVAVVAGAVACLGILFAAYGIRERESVFAGGEQATRDIANHTALIAEGTIEATHQLLNAMEFLVAAPGAAAPQKASEIHESLLKLRSENPHVMDLLIVSPDGVIEHWTGEGTPPDIRDRDYFNHHLATPGSHLFVGAPLKSKVHAGKWFFGISQAIRDKKGELDRVVVAITDVSIFSVKLARVEGAPFQSQALITKDGTVYARVPSHGEYAGKTVDRPTNLAELTPQNQKLTTRLVSPFDQLDRIVSFQHLNNFPLIAAGSISTDSLLAPWRRQTIQIAILWLLLSAGIVWIGMRSYATNHKLNQLANIDSLTGVQNRRSILAAASKLERSQAHAGTLSLLMIDVDHFKTINDRFGHHNGDIVLKKVSAVLRTHVRQTDIVGRFGGEEFLVLMPNTGPEGAQTVAEKLCRAVSETITEPTTVTMSIGIATTSESDASFEQALSRADAALYAAKAAGRNCVRVNTASARPGPGPEDGAGLTPGPDPR